MGRSRTRSGSRDAVPVDEGELDAESAAREAEEADPSPRPPTKELPDRSIKLTAKRCLMARSRDPVVAAFLYTENLGETRKLTREEWDTELEAFKGAPR